MLGGLKAVGTSASGIHQLLAFTTAVFTNSSRALWGGIVWPLRAYDEGMFLPSIHDLCIHSYWEG